MFNGTGDDVVDIGPGNTRFVLQATHDGESNFQVELLDAALQPIDFPFNEIGAFSGTVVMNSTDGRYLQVSADGNWSLQLIDASTLPVVGDTFNGAGDSVVRYNGAGGIFTMTHDGESNFQVVLHDVTTGEATAFVVNEIGVYSGRNPLTAGPGADIGRSPTATGPSPRADPKRQLIFAAMSRSSRCSIAVVVALVALSACSSSGESDESIAPSTGDRSTRCGRIQPTELAATFGQAEPIGDLQVTTSDPTIGTDDGGPWLTVTVRAENHSAGDVQTPQFELRCAR